MTYTTQNTVPRLGTKIEGSGAILLAYTHKHDGGGGMYPNGVGICFQPSNDLHPYVVWNIITSDGGQTWFAEAGTYCMHLIEALISYSERGGKGEELP